MLEARGRAVNGTCGQYWCKSPGLNDVPADSLSGLGRINYEGVPRSFALAMSAAHRGLGGLFDVSCVGSHPL